MKDLITGKRIFVNPKGQAGFEIDNHMNFLLFTNEPNAAKLDADDRRYFVWRSQAAPKDQQYYQDLTAWFHGNGKRHVLDFLLRRDLSQFQRHKAPPKTPARAALIHESRADWEQYLLDAFDASDAPFDSELCIVNDLVDYFGNVGHLRISARQATSFLRDVVGATNLGQRRIRNGDGTARKPRIWAVRNSKRWEQATEAEIAAAYRKPVAGRQRAPASTDPSSAPQPRPGASRQFPSVVAVNDPNVDSPDAEERMERSQA